MANDTYSRGYRNDPAGCRETGAAGAELDPLTELARLIGQGDPFAPVARRPALRDGAPNAASRDRPPEPPPYEAGYDDQGENRAPDAHYGAERREFPADDNQQLADHGYGYEEGGTECAAHDNRAEYDADRHDGHPGNRFYGNKAPTLRRRGWMMTAAALIGLAIVGAVLAFGYRAVFTRGTPPLIARDLGPNKIIPSSQTAEARSTKGDDRVSPGDQPDRMGSQERMVSHEERPIALTDTPGAPGFAQNSAASQPPPMQPVLPSHVASAEPAVPDNAAPRKVQTVTIPADGAAPAAKPAPPRTVAPRATAAQASAQPTRLQVAPRAPAPPSSPPQAGQPSPQVATAAPPPPRAAARAEAGSGYYVQVAAQRSEEEAQSAFRGIQEKYANLLGGHEPVIRRKDLGSKGIFFGVQVGPFARESAVELCDNLKSAGGSCMVQKN